MVYAVNDIFVSKGQVAQPRFFKIAKVHSKTVTVIEIRRGTGYAPFKMTQRSDGELSHGFDYYVKWDKTETPSCCQEVASVVIGISVILAAFASAAGIIAALGGCCTN